MRRRLGNTEKGETRSAARRQIGRPRSIAAASLEAQSITQAEQATNSTDDRVLASGPTNPERAVDTAHIKDRAVTKGKVSTDGAWPENDIPQLAKGKIQAAGVWAESDIPQLAKGKIQAGGQWGKGEVPGDTVYGNAQGKLSYADIIDKPSLGQYLTRGEADRLYAGNAQSVNNPNHHKHG